MRQTEIILQVQGVDVCYATRDGRLQALEDVSFDLRAGETLGVVGESGCGKSTLGRVVLGLVTASRGRVLWLGQELARRPLRERRAARRDLQVIFQDPLASLDPRMTIGECIDEPLRIHEPHLPASETRERVLRMLARVGLPAEGLQRYPHELSGGQCQRVGIARAMILQPRLVVCDEPVSALDVSVQGQIVNLLQELQAEFSLALLFISHNLAIVRRLSQRILVMYLGHVVESGPADGLLVAPRHPYTRALLAALPRAPGDTLSSVPRLRLVGELPSPLAPPPGCVFHTRCPVAEPRCAGTRPMLERVGDGREIACLRWREL